MLAAVTFLAVLVGRCFGQQTPAISFISPDIVTDIGL
jgi:hypothetical protein